MIHFLKDYLKILKWVLMGKYKWMFLLYLLWLYRITFIHEDGSGVGKIIQIVTLLGMLFYMNKFSAKRNIVGLSFGRTNMAVKTCLFLYVYGVLSTVWAYLPQYAFFLAFQNVVLIWMLVWLFLQFKTFESIEKSFLLLSITTIIFEFCAFRLTGAPQLFVHFLGNGSSAALMVSYTIGELFAAKAMTKERKRFLKSILFISIFVLVTSTSSGANASAIFGFAIACVFSGKILWAIMLGIPALVLYFNPDLTERLVYFIMPGKTKETIESATGRELIWEYIRELITERPIEGWGFGCVERIASDRSGIAAPDAHNNFLGFRGSLGYIGLGLAILNFISIYFISLKHKMKPGYVGIISAISCGLLNGYSYGFLSGKACSITVIFFALVVLTYFYSRKELWIKKLVIR